jgi:hypothetical protein
MSEKVYQRKNGTFYVKPSEFVSSSAGQRLLDRFIKSDTTTEESKREAEAKKSPESNRSKK